MKYIFGTLALVSVVLSSLACAPRAIAAEPINTLENKALIGYAASGVAIRGFDTVAYFTQNGPVEGSDSFTSLWQGATWRFSSQEHLDLFEADPEKYAPQYGGYCAFGVAEGGLVKIEPNRWSIVDGKLYLNYDNKVQRLWKEDIPGYIATANGKFKALLASE